MSTLGYAALTTKREEGTPDKTQSTDPPGVKTYVDSLAALVPAEVLALHGLILNVTTMTVDGKTEITDPEVLSWAFVGLLLLSIILYVGYRLIAKKWDKLDLLRLLIPPAAFIGWTMIQRPTVFDAVFPGLAWTPRTVIALFLAAVLLMVATALAYKADQKPQESEH